MTVGEQTKHKVSNMQRLQSLFCSLKSIDQPQLHNVYMKCSFNTTSQNYSSWHILHQNK